MFPTESYRSEPHCSVCLPTCKNSNGAERICIKFNTVRVFQKFVDQCSTEDMIKVSEKTQKLLKLSNLKPGVGPME